MNADDHRIVVVSYLLTPFARQGTTPLLLADLGRMVVKELLHATPGSKSC